MTDENGQTIGVIDNPEVPFGNGADGVACAWITDNGCHESWAVIGALYPDGELRLLRISRELARKCDNRSHDPAAADDMWAHALRGAYLAGARNVSLSMWDDDAQWRDEVYREWLIDNHTVLVEAARRMTLTAARALGADVA